MVIRVKWREILTMGFFLTPYGTWVDEFTPATHMGNLWAVFCPIPQFFQDFKIITVFLGGGRFKNSLDSLNSNPGKPRKVPFFCGNWIAGFRGFQLMEMNVATGDCQDETFWRGHLWRCIFSVPSFWVSEITNEERINPTNQTEPQAMKNLAVVKMCFETWGVHS